jgi:hypothetical protein
MAQLPLRESVENGLFGAPAATYQLVMVDISLVRGVFGPLVFFVKLSRFSLLKTAAKTTF